MEKRSTVYKSSKRLQCYHCKRKLTSVFNVCVCRQPFCFHCIYKDVHHCPKADPCPASDSASDSASAVASESTEIDPVRQ